MSQGHLFLNLCYISPPSFSSEVINCLNFMSLVFLGSTRSDWQGLHKVRQHFPHHVIAAPDQGWSYSPHYQNLQIPESKIHHYIQIQKELSRKTSIHVHRNPRAFSNHMQTRKVLTSLFFWHNLGILLLNLLRSVFLAYSLATFLLQRVHHFLCH